MKKILIIYFVLFSLNAPGFGQIKNVQVLNTILQENDHASIIGSPFLFDGWKLGQLIEKDGYVHDNLMLNYDLCSNQLLINKNGLTMEVDRDQYEKIIVDGVSYTVILTNVEISGEKIKSLIPLYTGKNHSLFKYIKCEIYEKTIADLGAEKNVKEYHRNTIYLIEKNNEYIVVEGKNTFYTLFEEDLIRKILKTARLRIKREQDLIELIELLDK